MSRQTLLPNQWIIVDDGSTDNSKSILEKAAGTYGWITIVSRADRGCRKPGTGVIEAFYDGLAQMRSTNWDFLVKLDGDVTFDFDYFESCFGKFASDPRLGIGGGLVCNRKDGALKPESTIDPTFHVRGATKIYRRACWDAIGAVIRAPGWDTLDEFKANRLQWKTRTFADITLLHHKPAGSADGSWPNWVKNGLANYIVGYHPVFMLCKSIKRLFCKPYGIGAMGLLSGYLGGYLNRVPQIDDKETIDYLRKEQMKRLLRKASIYS
jgi:poly-beta-1,6-N-acetyl-D-glucosamine synthase